MSFPDVLMLGTALLCGLLGWKNLTAVGLVLSYVVVRAAWYGFSINILTSLSVALDLTVIALIYCKPPAHDCFPYKNAGEQLRAFWCELSLQDRIVLAIFPVAWACYVAPLSDYHRWWAMYWLAMAQFVAAGMESVHRYLIARTAKRASAPEPPSSGLLFMPGRENRGYG